MKFRNVKIRGKMKNCAACGDNPTITDVSKFDYAEFCHTNCDEVAKIKLPDTNTISITEFGKLYKNE